MSTQTFDDLVRELDAEVVTTPGPTLLSKVLAIIIWLPVLFVIGFTVVAAAVLVWWGFYGHLVAKGGFFLLDILLYNS